MFIFNNKLEIKNINKEIEKLNEEILSVKNNGSIKYILKNIFMKFIKEVFNYTIEFSKKTIYLIKFKGDLNATEVKNLRFIITALLNIILPQDEVLICINSFGGTFTGYGLAAIQLERLRKRNIKLTVIVDNCAASGGYLMACVANKIIASPFSIIGSIGVIVQIPNIYNLLKKYDINVHTYATSNYKSGITPIGKITEESEIEIKNTINSCYNLFTHYVKKYRSHLDLSTIACGKVWIGKESLKLGLIDEISSSDEVILKKIAQGYNVLEISKNNDYFFNKFLETILNLFSKINNFF